jgi:3-oxoacyl-[acyl-carrier-protein] synthase-3
MFMIQQLAKKLKIDETKILRSGHKYGNPSSASVPLTIADAFLNSPLKKDITQFIAGFGGGLSIGTGLIDLKSDTYFNIIKKG